MTNDANNVDENVLMPGQTDGKTIDDAIADSSTAAETQASEEKHEEKQDGVQKRFNKLTYEKHEAVRENLKLKAELEAAQQIKPEVIQTAETVSAPNLPNDMYDEDEMKKYHSEMLSYNAKVAEVAANKTFESHQQDSQKKAQEADLKRSLNTYIDNAIKDGVNVEKLPMVEQTLNNAGINPQLGQFLINDPNGAKVAEYLVDNPAEMYDILQLDPVSAGIKIQSEIKQKALSKTPNVSSAPDPIKQVVGGGYVEKDEFDKSYPGAHFL